MQVDDEQQLWVIILARKDDWQDHIEERVMRSGRIAYRPTDDDGREIYQSRIDLIDLANGSLIATGRDDALLEAYCRGWVGSGECGLRTVSPSDGHLEAGFQPVCGGPVNKNRRAADRRNPRPSGDRPNRRARSGVASASEHARHRSPSRPARGPQAVVMVRSGAAELLHSRKFGFQLS